MFQLFLRGHSFPTPSEIWFCGGRPRNGLQGARALLWIDAFEKIKQKSDCREEEVELQFRLTGVSANQAGSSGEGLSCQSGPVAG